jgi:hypothetical protein
MSRRPVSAVVGAAARQHAQDDDLAGRRIAVESDAPIPDADTPFACPGETPDVQRGVLIEQALDRCEHPTGYLRVKAPEIPPRARCVADAPS